MVFSSQVFAMQADAPTAVPTFVSTVPVVEKKPFFDSAIVPEPVIVDNRAEKIEKYFARHNLPLGGQAEYFIISADKYDIDWRLVAAIGFIESTGGEFACKTVGYNAWGWGSCTLGFDSYAEAIDVISKNLAGQHPKTAYHYADKDVRGKLESYNPPSIVPDYADKVMREMRIIDEQ
ncbi:MAG: hypothetical protein ACPGTS_01190 [Minisyncoccia bacterium]